MAVALLVTALGWARLPAAGLIGGYEPEPGGDRRAFFAIVAANLPIIGQRILSCRIGVERAGRTILDAHPGADFCAEAARNDGRNNLIVWSGDRARVEFAAGVHKATIEAGWR